MLRKIVKEPRLHFAVMAAAILAAYGLLESRDANAPDNITVTAPRIEQLAAVFAKTWQRPPTEAELKGMIDDYVKDEIYSREALKMGLDRDDTVIRRRLRQKMEFLNEAAADELMPTDADLAAYLKSHQKEFEIEASAAFEQVFVNPQLHGDHAEQEAGRILKVLTAASGADASTLGDPTMLPPEVPLTSKPIIAQTFGADFADAVIGLQPMQWAGPIKSEYGYHLVRVTEHKAGRVPGLPDVRDIVLREWRNAKRQELEDARLKELLKLYDVKIETASGSAQP